MTRCSLCGIPVLKLLLFLIILNKNKLYFCCKRTPMFKTKPSKVLLALFILSSINGLGQTLHNIRGVVRYNGEAVPGARITLEPANLRMETDSLGYYRFSNLNSGIYTIKAESNGNHKKQEVILPQASMVVDFIFEDDSEILDVLSIAAGREQHNQGDFIKASHSAMPVVTIDKRTIELMGSRRLDEVLKEQTGMAIVNNIGGGTRSTGVQIQGFGSEYIMVLIDGQPLVGRSSGDLDLSRISVSGIERIEIIKGASSSLYGSEALGGTINIITKAGAVDPQVSAAVAYGTFNILDITAEGQAPLNEKGSVYIGTNYYRTDGFNTNTKYIKGVTSPPYDNYAFQARSKYSLGENSVLAANIRYGLRKSLMQKDFGIGTVSDDQQDEQDLNMAFSLEKRVSSRFKMLTRYYYTYYSADMSIKLQNNHTKLVQEVFTQDQHRIDQQFSLKSGSEYHFVGGIGGSMEDMKNQQLVQVDKLFNYFSYAQGEWAPLNSLKLTGGLRYDGNNQYKGRLNPSIGLQYALTSSLTFKTGAGTGFKAPDFKKNYQVFYNATANYLLIGNAVLRQTLEEMDSRGQISEVRTYVLNQTAGKLQAEKSTSYHAGFEWKPSEKIKIENSFFLHRIRNQINSIQVATGMNNQIIYTYQNLPKAVNKGIDLSIKYSPLENLNIGMGYQYLESKDLSVRDSIRAGKWPYNQNIHDPATGKSYLVSDKDYWGIENRSRHMANFHIFYGYRPWGLNATVRASYRGKYPFGDRNGNHFIDRYDTFVSGHFLLNTSLEKKLVGEKLSLRISVDNLFNYTDPLMPGQPGRIVLFGASYRLFKEES